MLIKVKLETELCMRDSLLMLPIFWIVSNWPLACISVNKSLLLLYLSLLSWFLALDKGCSAMNSSLKATVLEYIYKWTKKGWDTHKSVSCIHHPGDRHRTSFVNTKHLFPQEICMVHTQLILVDRPCHKKRSLFNFRNTHSYSGEKKPLRINAGSPPSEVTFLASWSLSSISPSLEMTSDRRSWNDTAYSKAVTSHRGYEQHTLSQCRKRREEKAQSDSDRLEDPWMEAKLSFLSPDESN